MSTFFRRLRDTYLTIYKLDPLHLVKGRGRLLCALCLKIEVRISGKRYSLLP